MGEREIKIVLVPKEQICEEYNMIRISCDGFKDGWGLTLERAIKNFDLVNCHNYNYCKDFNNIK